MKTHITIESARLFNVKPFGSGSKFGIKISSKKQDGTYTKGNFLNCKCKEMLSEGQNYTLTGFLADNEYQDKNTLELIVMTAVAAGVAPAKKEVREVKEDRTFAANDDTESIPF